MSWRLKSQATRLLIQQFVEGEFKGKLKSRVTDPSHWYWSNLVIVPITEQFLKNMGKSPTGLCETHNLSTPNQSSTITRLHRMITLYQWWIGKYWMTNRIKRNIIACTIDPIISLASFTFKASFSMTICFVWYRAKMGNYWPRPESLMIITVVEQPAMPIVKRTLNGANPTSRCLCLTFW